MNELRKTQRLRGKNVVVIGGSRGLGKTIVAAVELASDWRERAGKTFLVSASGIELLS